MEKDKYYLKLEREYIHATGSYPTARNISDYIYERGEKVQEFIKSLEELGLFNNNIITELDKGCLDTIFNNYNKREEDVLIEISEYGYTFFNDTIHVISGNLDLNKKNEIRLNNCSKKRDSLGFLLDSVIKEGELDARKFPLYAKMYYDDINLYIGIIGGHLDKNKNQKINELLYLKEKVLSLSNINLQLYENDSNEMYQRILYYKKIK